MIPRTEITQSSRDRQRLVALAALAALVLGVLAWRTLRSSRDPRQKLVAIEYRLVATSDDGRPLADVALELKGKTVGKTDERGELTLPLRGRSGASIPFTVKCPATHVGSPTIPPVVLRPRRTPRSEPVAAAPPVVAPPLVAPPAAAPTAAAPPVVAPGGGSDAPAATPTQTIEATVACDRRVRRAAVLVRVLHELTKIHHDDRGRTTESVEVVPLLASISLDGAEVAKIDGNGVAHLALERPPGTKLELEITPDSDDLDSFAMPFDIAEVDDVYVLERTVSQTVETRAARKKPRVIKRRPAKRASQIKVVPRNDAPFLDL